MPSAQTQHTDPCLLAFKPRQVLLPLRQQQNMKKQHLGSSIETIEHAPKVLKLDQSVLLQNSIVIYLQRHGFSKTLKKFCSEANVKNEGLEHVSLDLEEMCSKYMESCNGRDTPFNSLEQGMPVLSANTDCKKKKKRSEESESNGVVFQVGGACDKVSKAKNLTQNSTNSLVTESELKSMEKKNTENNSLSFDYGKEQGCIEAVKTSVMGQSAEEASTDDVVPASEVNSKGKKKKKVLDSIVDGSEQVSVGAANVSADGIDKVSKAKDPDTMSKDDIPVLEKKPKEKKKKKHASEETEEISAVAIKVSKEKKKKKDRPVSVVYENSVKQPSLEEVQEDKKEKKEKDKKKRKWSASDENDCQPVDEVVPEKSKRQKTEGQEEEAKSQLIKETNGFQKTVGISGKKIKTDKNKVQDTSDMKLLAHGNGNPEKTGEEKFAVKKTIEKQSKQSVEPKTIHAFQRVKADQVVYADERLQDNSYWAKHGAENGYGAKAQEVLGQVRGRDFRHEKTKKKRGSYRGGQIDMESHSIKFNYSDED